MLKKYLRIVFSLSVGMGLLVALPFVAEASHFRGGAMLPSVSATGILTVTSTSFWRPSAGNSSFTELAPVVTGVGSMTSVSSVWDTSDSRFSKRTQVHTRFLQGGAGSYDIRSFSCCRVAGIHNATQSNFDLNSRINWTGPGASNNPILFNFSAVQPEVVRGSNYAGNLSALSGNGGTLSYDQNLNISITSQPPGFTVDPNTGALFIPLTDTAGYLDNPTSNIGADYAFSGNISNSDGSKVEFDWLFDAVNTGPTVNNAPVGDDTSITVNLGDTVSHTFTGSDPDGDPLSWSFVSMLGASPALAPVFNPTTQLFTWNTTGSSTGNYIAQALLSDGSLTDLASLNITVQQGSVPPVPEPATMILLGVGMVGLGILRRRKTDA